MMNTQQVKPYAVFFSFGVSGMRHKFPKHQGCYGRYGIGSHKAFRFSTGVPEGISHPAVTM